MQLKTLDFIKAEPWHSKWHVDEDDDDDNNEDDDDDNYDSGNDDGDTGNDDGDTRKNEYNEWWCMKYDTECK